MTEKFERQLLQTGDTLKSGDLIEVELIIESKNDYEHLLFEDLKGSGFEAVDQRSGYIGGGLGAFRELRDQHVALLVRRLPQGRHSLTYRLRAEIPGKFGVLPCQARGVYAPELRGNSASLRLGIEDE